MRYVLDQPLLRASLTVVTILNLFSWMLQALLVLYMSRTLGLSAPVIGAAFAAGAVGGLLGAAMSPRVTRAIGFGPTIVLGAALVPAALAMIPLARGPVSVAATMVGGSQFLLGLGSMFFDVNNNSLYALLIPYRLRARGSGTVRFFGYGVRPLGALAGGFMGAWLGLRPTLWVAAGGVLAAAARIVWSPIVRLRRAPHPVEAAHAD